MAAFIRRVARATIVAGAALTVCSGVATAAVVQVQPAVQRRADPMVQRQPRLGQVVKPQTWQPHKLGPHVFYGKITAINGSILTLHLRNGHILDVDATDAIAGGNFSAPLFVGKLVSVDGTEANNTFTATHVFRVINLNNLRNDN